MLAQANTQVADLDDRFRASVAAEREASARSNQQAMSLAELSARLQQQLDSSRANDERQRQWTEAQMATLLFPSSPSSSSAAPGSNASSSSTSRPALMSPGMGSTSLMYAASGNRVPSTLQPRTRAAWKDLHTFADNGDALTAVASTLLNAKAVRLESASLTPEQVLAFVVIYSTK